MVREMEDKYKDLIDEFSRLDSRGNLENVEVYDGFINGRYDREYNINTKEVFDDIHSDGNMHGSPSAYEIENANYVYIVRYRNSDNDVFPAKAEKVSLFLNDETEHEIAEAIFNSHLKNTNNRDLYKKVFNPENKKSEIPSISQYEVDDAKGLVIYPSDELKKMNKSNTR